MKALIFNSGLGSRLGELTANRPKCLVELPGSESILHRQLRVLTSCGIREFVVTTGPYAELVERVCREFVGKERTFSFVRNDRYDQTNYIYSMWLAREQLAGNELLILHGDLVFDAAYVRKLLDAPNGSLGSVDPSLPLPEKDFKARVIDGRIHEVGVNVWGDECVAFQAMYRLTASSLDTWLARIDSFVQHGNTGVYAENAANEVFCAMDVHAFSYTGHVLEEIDTPEDLKRVGNMICLRDYADQTVYELTEDGMQLVMGSEAGCNAHEFAFEDVATAFGLTHPLVVADSFLSSEQIDGLLGSTPRTLFTDFWPNPTYEQALAAVNAYKDGRCDSVVSIGGGSAMDVAKCVRLWAACPGDGLHKRYCDTPLPYSNLTHIAIPTTAGTGSESTHFSVVYVDGEKRSVASCLAQPNACILVPELLSGLPPYQRRATVLDALCHAIESYWSVASSAQSREYSRRAIESIRAHWLAYLDDDARAAAELLRAANLSGKAINLTTTTAAHAMSYKLTSLFGIAHGHAVALCLPYCWKTLLERASVQTQERLFELDCLLTGSTDPTRGAGLDAFANMFSTMELPEHVEGSNANVDVLVQSVNLERLSNFPLQLNADELRSAYRSILNLA